MCISVLSGFITSPKPLGFASHGCQAKFPKDADSGKAGVFLVRKCGIHPENHRKSPVKRRDN